MENPKHVSGQPVLRQKFVPGSSRIGSRRDNHGRNIWSERKYHSIYTEWFYDKLDAFGTIQRSILSERYYKPTVCINVGLCYDVHKSVCCPPFSFIAIKLPNKLEASESVTNEQHKQFYASVQTGAETWGCSSSISRRLIPYGQVKSIIVKIRFITELEYSWVC